MRGRLADHVVGGSAMGLTSVDDLLGPSCPSLQEDVWAGFPKFVDVIHDVGAFVCVFGSVERPLGCVLGCTLIGMFQHLGHFCHSLLMVLLLSVGCLPCSVHLVQRDKEVGARKVELDLGCDGVGALGVGSGWGAWRRCYPRLMLRSNARCCRTDWWSP